MVTGNTWLLWVGREAQRETALVKDILGEAGLPCDELNPSGPRSYPEDHRAQVRVEGLCGQN